MRDALGRRHAWRRGPAPFDLTAKRLAGRRLSNGPQLVAGMLVWGYGEGQRAIGLVVASTFRSTTVLTWLGAPLECLPAFSPYAPDVPP